MYDYNSQSKVIDVVEAQRNILESMSTKEKEKESIDNNRMTEKIYTAQGAYWYPSEEWLN